MRRFNTRQLLIRHKADIKKYGISYAGQVFGNTKDNQPYSHFTIAFGRHSDPKYNYYDILTRSHRTIAGPRLHREDGPACLYYNLRGYLIGEEYWLHGRVHRDGSPAQIWYDLRGNIQLQIYCVDHSTHREDGPAIIYTPTEGLIVDETFFDDFRKISIEDGELYYLNGVNVPKHFVMQPETITLSEIHKVLNIELKRALIERYGWLRYMEEIGAEVIDTRTNDVDGTQEVLVRCKMNDAAEILLEQEPEQLLLICSCPSTGRVYPVQVPNTVANCNDAQKWLCGPKQQKTRIIGAS